MITTPIEAAEVFFGSRKNGDVDQAVERAVERAELPEIEPAGGFLETEIPEPPQIIKNVLHATSKLVVGGASKSFKTWTLLHLAVAVSTGKPWLNFDTEKGRVLFINFEMARFAIQRRLKALAKVMGVRLDNEFLSIWNLRGHAAPFQILIPRILDRIRDEGYVLVILDPLYKLLGNADENSATDIARLLNALESVTECGAGIAFGAHYSKGNQAAKSSIDRISGSGVFARDPDAILTFTAHEEPQAFTVESILRNFKPVDPFVVRWDAPIMRPVSHLDPERLKQPKGRGSVYNRDHLLALVASSPLTTTAWQKKARAELGIGSTRFYELLAGLKSENAISEAEPGKWLKNS
jgi:hypothetical protein